MSEFKFQLGETAEDIITGFTGVIMARSQYLTQCNSYGLLNPKLSKEGTHSEWVWFDEPRIKISKNSKRISLVDPAHKKTGGTHRKSEIPPQS